MRYAGRQIAVSTELSVYSGARHGVDEEGDDLSYASRGVESDDGDSWTRRVTTSPKPAAVWRATTGTADPPARRPPP